MITTPFIVSLAVSAASTILLLSLILVLGFGSRAADGDKSVPDRLEMRRHALWRILYVNPNDPRGWVPKLYGYGFTVNFRRKAFAVMFAASVVLTLASAVCLAIFRPH